MESPGRVNRAESMNSSVTLLVLILASILVMGAIDRDDVTKIEVGNWVALLAPASYAFVFAAPVILASAKFPAVSPCLGMIVPERPNGAERAIRRPRMVQQVGRRARC